MRRALRWQILVPRLLMVIVALLSAQYLLGLAARSIIVRSGEAATAARFELAHARVSLTDQQLVLSDIRLARPLQRPGATLFEADQCELDLAAAPLLHKQAIVNRGRITGLRIDTLGQMNRTTSGANASGPASLSALFGDDSDAIARTWLAHLGERFKSDFINQYDSVQRTEELCARWSTQSAALETREQQLDERAAELQHSVESAHANPLRNDKFFVGLPDEIATLKKEFAELAAEVEKLPDWLESQRRVIIAARRRDDDQLRERLCMEPVDANALTAYLLRRQAVAPLNELVVRLRWIREVVPTSAAARQSPKRGEDVLFAGCRQSPGVLIRELQLQGAARIGGQPVELRGMLTNISTSPALHGEPIHLRLATTGSMRLELRATIDRTGPVAQDEVLADCHGIVLPQIALGRSDQLEMLLAPSVGSLSASISVQGEKLAGDIQMVQKNVRITPALKGELSDVPLGRALQETLGRVNALATRLSVGGTLNEPTCTLWSNIGPAVAEAIERSLQRAGDAHAQSLLAQAGRRVDERLADIERQIVEKQTRFASHTTNVTRRLDNIAAQQSPHYRISTEQLGRRLPANSLFR